MTTDTLIMLSGAFVAVLPFLGLPNSWDKIFFFIAGVFVVALGIVVRRQGKNLVVSRQVRNSHFVEHIPDAEQRAPSHEEI